MQNIQKKFFSIFQYICWLYYKELNLNYLVSFVEMRRMKQSHAWDTEDKSEQ